MRTEMHKFNVTEGFFSAVIATKANSHIFDGREIQYYVRDLDTRKLK